MRCPSSRTRSTATCSSSAPNSASGSSTTAARLAALAHGLPTVSVMDLAIQPREHDLVIATHGRGLYILDDIRPLRSLSARSSREPLHLFPVADARQHASDRKTGGFARRQRRLPRREPALRRLLTYSLNHPGLPLPDAEGARAQGEGARRRAGRRGDQKPAKAAGGNPHHRRRRQARPHFGSPPCLGVNRAAWDLRRDAFKSPPTTPRPAAPQNQPVRKSLPAPTPSP